MKMEISLDQIPTYNKSNLTRKECSVLNELASNHNIYIKCANKGSTITELTT